jgi:hypothetical protein
MKGPVPMPCDERMLRCRAPETPWAPSCFIRSRCTISDGLVALYLLAWWGGRELVLLHLLSNRLHLHRPSQSGHAATIRPPVATPPQLDLLDDGCGYVPAPPAPSKPFRPRRHNYRHNGLIPEPYTKPSRRHANHSNRAAASRHSRHSRRKPQAKPPKL